MMRLVWIRPRPTLTNPWTFLKILVKSSIPSNISAAILRKKRLSAKRKCLWSRWIAIRLQGKLGFLGANLVQSLLFGLIHALMFIQLIGDLKAKAIFAFTSLIAFVFGSINEQKANGSILPSILIHSLANTIVGLFLGFSLI